jgi:protoheme IX farnesyltransferase
VDAIVLFELLIGTALLAAGGGVLNMLLERREDALMERTKDRPIPAGRILAQEALLLGVAFSLSGILALAFVHPLTLLLGVISLAVYLFVYTPLKKVSTLCTPVGAISGAIPPLMGWAAATGTLSFEAWLLFAILFFWQLPHFLAIAWIYREDYARGGFPMLAVHDPEGAASGRQAVLQTLALVLVTLFAARGDYFVGTLLLGLGFLVCAVLFARARTRPNARRLFLASIGYLPLLLTLLLLGR